jgi:CDP-diacylglycerol---glycerol-3-phosphate 3-phosphatidyltransferase
VGIGSEAGSTTVRFVLSIVVFVLIPLGQFIAAMIVFLIAASTDWIDGWWARKFNQVTKLGRIFDPFVDKIIICGTFIFLAAEWPSSGIAPWMAVVVMGREMLVTAIRSEIEGRGSEGRQAKNGLPVRSCRRQFTRASSHSSHR